MAQAGVLMRVLPGADSAPLAPLVHLEETQGIAPDWVRRLAALGGEDAFEEGAGDPELERMLEQRARILAGEGPGRGHHGLGGRASGT